MFCCQIFADLFRDSQQVLFGSKLRFLNVCLLKRNLTQLRVYFFLLGKSTLATVEAHPRGKG